MEQEYTGSDDSIKCKYKDLQSPLMRRNSHICGFFKMLRNLSLIIFEDGVVWHLDNEDNRGVVSKYRLKLPFEKVVTVLYEEEHQILMLQDAKLERVFYHYDNNNWAFKKLNVPSKYTIIKLIGKFLLVSYNEGLTYLVEMNGEEMGLHVQLGDETVWNYKIDADQREQSFALQFKQDGQSFLWQKFDQQRQFHLTKPNCFEMVCDKTLIRVYINGVQIEIKEDLSRFEERFYDFLPMDFAGLPIIMSNFTPYKIPGENRQILLVINPKPSLLKTEQKKQYLVLLDLDTLKAHDCTIIEEPSADRITKVFFFQNDSFLGQVKVNFSSLNKIIKYQIIKRVDDMGTVGYNIVQQPDQCSIKMKRVTAFAYDVKAHNLLLMLERKLEEDECFEILQLRLKNAFDPSKSYHTHLVDVDINEVATAVKSFEVFTTPISVFQRYEELYAAASYIQETEEIYALIGNQQFSLLFRADLNKKKAEELRFEQIVTIRQVKELLLINDRQLLAISNTECVIFQRDPTECDDMKHYFDEGSTEIQCKRLVGKNIDIKVDFEQTIHSITCESMIIALQFGIQSCLLELDDQKSRKLQEDNEIQNQVCNLNDLVFINKRLLREQYNMDGYIHITEDQGKWDSSEPKLPVVLKAADFVTVFQDDDGNQGSDQSALIKNIYLIEYNIWESLIRDAMLQGSVPITHEQIFRFLTPVLSDNNNNLLHHFSYNHLDSLEMIVEMPGFESYYDVEKKMFPIFYNFYGETQINIALLAHDNPSFYKLLDIFVKMQACLESSFLVNSWLLKAFEEGLDIICLLNSQIMQTKLNASFVEHWKTWPEFHNQTDLATVNYEQPYLVLLHDEVAYKNLFGADFKHDPNQEETSKLQSSEYSDERKELYPIFYYAERLPIYSTNEDEHYENIFKLLQILSETEQLKYFQCPFVTRLIDWMWDSQLVSFYNVVSGMYMLSYVIIVGSSLALRFFHTEPVLSAQIRAALLSVNIIILILSLGTFEVKSILENGLSYFDSFWNKNDVLLFTMSIVCLVQEFINLKYQKQKHERKLAEADEDEEEPEQIINYGFDYKAYYLAYDPQESALRVTYSILVINTHLKTLNVLSFYSSVAFIIKAMAAVFEGIQGYAVFFLYLVLMYALSFNALDQLWFHSDALYPQGDYNGVGGMAFAMFVGTFRNSLGDNIIYNFQFPETPQLYVMWFLWLSQLILQFFLMMNFAIQIAEGGYGSVKEVQIEEAYQKKCAIICELYEVFGKIASRKSTNILVTREWVHEADVNEDANDTITGVKKQQAINKIDTLKKMDQLQRTIFTQNNRILKQVAELTRMIKHRAQISKVTDPSDEIFNNEKVNHPISDKVAKDAVSSAIEQADFLKMAMEGNLSSYRTSNIDYGSYMDESYFSQE